MQILAWLFVKLQKYGVFGFIRRGWEKFSIYLRFYWHAAQYILWKNRLPSDHKLLRETQDECENLKEVATVLSNKSSRALPFSAYDRDTFIKLLRNFYPDSIKETLKLTDKIRQRQFYFLGKEFHFRDRIDWHLDPDSGRQWPKIYYEFLDRWLWTDRRIGDIKLPWELNRHQYFIILGKAYWLKNDERYAEEFVNQVVSWIEENPCGFGINWYSSLEIAVRIISWSLAFLFFRRSPTFIDKGSRLFLKSLYQQTSFLFNHLTLDWEVRNNHILGETAALIIVGCIFSEFIESNNWLNLGLKIFETEILQQTYPDGPNKEQAISYHRFVLDFLLLIIIMARRGTFPKRPKLEQIAENMLDYLMYMITPNRKVPPIGDADDGRGYYFDKDLEFWDFRSSLAVGAVLFQRPDFKYVAQEFSQEAFWLLGPKGLQTFEELKSFAPRKASMRYPQAGIYIIREDWGAQSDFGVFRCGTLGLGGDGFCAHAHCDLLSPLLWIRGREILIDPGTYSYDGPLRDYFRNTQAHNTLRVDDNEQANPKPYFGWQDIPQAKCISWDKDHITCVIQATPSVIQCRELNHPRSGLWKIVDFIDGEGAHKLEWMFHFSPDLSLFAHESRKYITVKQEEKSFVRVIPPLGVYLQIEIGWCSMKYGQKMSNPVLSASWNGVIPTTGLSFCWKFQYIDKAR